MEKIGHWKLEADSFEFQLKFIAEEAIVGQEYVTTVLSSAKTEIDQSLHLHPSICIWRDPRWNSDCDNSAEMKWKSW